ncbi:MAG: SGNH/GDSL hydrolase family protein [Candidatus Binatia bacterium]
MAAGRGGRLLGGLFLAAFGAALALGMLEVGVRVLHLVPDRFWQPDPKLGTVLVPGASGWWTQEEHEFFVPIRINAAGRRDLDRTPQKPPGTFRILLLGDSFVEALQVPIEQTFARALEQRLTADAGRPVEVVSMGVSGYGTAAEYLWYRDVGRSFGPDLVLLSFYPGNDVRNNSPILEPTLRPVYAPDGTPDHIAGGKGGEGGGRGLLGRSAAYQYARKVVLTRQPALAARLAGWGLLDAQALRPVPMEQGVPVDYGVFAVHPSPAWQDAWAHTEATLAALRDAVRADGATLVIMVVTAREQVYPDDWTQLQATYPAMREQSWDLNGPERRVLSWCALNDVPCVPLSPAFVAARDNAPRLHWHFDGHWTPAGHALAAETMAAALQPAVRNAEGR